MNYAKLVVLLAEIYCVYILFKENETKMIVPIILLMLFGLAI